MLGVLLEFATNVSAPSIAECVTRAAARTLERLRVFVDSVQRQLELALSSD